MMRKYVSLGCLIACLWWPAFSDSLWDENFKGFIAGSSAFTAGDIVTVVIDSSFSLDFSSVSKNAKSITFEFTGGEYAGLFSFLPRTRTGDDRSVSGRERFALRTELAVRITEIDAAGKLAVTGTRTVQVGGKQETIVVTGRVDPKAVDASRRVNFSQIENARLSYTSLLEPSVATLSQADIQAIVTELSTGETDTATGQTTFKLSDQRKRELIVQYLNRLIDILFR